MVKAKISNTLFSSALFINLALLFWRYINIDLNKIEVFTKYGNQVPNTILALVLIVGLILLNIEIVLSLPPENNEEPIIHPRRLFFILLFSFISIVLSLDKIFLGFGFVHVNTAILIFIGILGIIFSMTSVIFYAHTEMAYHFIKLRGMSHIILPPVLIPCFILLLIILSVIGVNHFFCSDNDFPSMCTFSMFVATACGFRLI